MSDDFQIALLERWCDLGLEALASAREEIDGLNVYPVPDGDTGTNLYLTFESARQALVEVLPCSLAVALTVFSRGALLGARGNSGVILSQLVRAGAQQLMRGDPDQPGALLADTLSRAADAAYEAVGEPVEGTILTVARAAADAAQQALAAFAAESAMQPGGVVKAAAQAAREAVARTPDQLLVLKEAGVVDAGGRGLSILLDAAVEALTGQRLAPIVPFAAAAANRHSAAAAANRHSAAAAANGHSAAPLVRNVTRLTDREPADPEGRLVPGADLSADGPGYEVMYLLDCDDAAVPQLRKELGALGDSLVVVGGEGLWNVHVHVDDVGAAVEAGIEAGRPYRLRVTHFADRAPTRSRPTSSDEAVKRAVVTFAAGPGLTALFRAAGAVVPERQRPRCSTGEVLHAIRAAGALEVIVLPNKADGIPVAEAAGRLAREHGVRVAVIPTRTQVQGLAAVAVRQPGRSFDEDILAMSTAASHTRHGGVTVAARDAMTTAGPCHEGDTLGIVEADFALVGGTLAEAAVAVVERLLTGGGELVTLVTGADCPDDLVSQVAERLDQTRPDVELVVHAGGQPRYPVLVGVE